MKKDRIHALLKGIETADSASVAVVIPPRDQWKNDYGKF